MVDLFREIELVVKQNPEIFPSIDWGWTRTESAGHQESFQKER